MTVWTAAFFLATVFGCGQHFDYPWAPLLYISECNTNTRLDALMISDLITDVFVWLLPLPVVSFSSDKYHGSSLMVFLLDLESQHEDI